MPFSFDPFAARGRRIAAVAIVAGVVTASAGGAATVHRLTTAQGTGSEGATAFLQPASSSAALQGEVAGSANTSLKIPFGVLGDYDPSSGAVFGIGVAGVSTTGYAIGAEAFGTNPTVEVLAEGTGHGVESVTSSSGGGYAIDAIAKGTGDGVDGYAYNGGWGGYFSSQSGIGVQGVSSGSTSSSTAAAIYGLQLSGGTAGYFESAEGTGIHAVTDTSSAAAVLGDNSIGSRGILGDNTGEALVGFGHSGNSHAVITAVDAVGSTRLFSTQAYNGGSPATSFFIQPNTSNRSGDAVLSYSTDVQMSGDVYVYGRIYQDCEVFPAAATTSCEPVTAGSESTTASVSRSASGNEVTMYGTRQSLPTVEDEGTAQLVNGRAYVRLDPAFADTMSMQRAYRVYVTPAGPSKGVYVTDRTAQGFEVDENPGGRSTVAFDYRIVGAPYADRSARLPLAARKTAAKSVPDSNEGLRAQAAAVRGFDLARNRAVALHTLSRHPRPVAPASFATVNGFRASR